MLLAPLTTSLTTFKYCDFTANENRSERTTGNSYTDFSGGPTVTQPKIKNPKKEEAGRKGALVRKLKKQQREKEEIDRITYTEQNEPQIKEKPVIYKQENGVNIINYSLIIFLSLGIGYIAYQKYKDKPPAKQPIKYVKLDMK